MLKIFNKILPKIVIVFETKGCMGHIHEYLGIGYVINTYTKEDSKFYDLKMINKQGEDFRDGVLSNEKAWQLQHLFANLYIHYK